MEKLQTSNLLHDQTPELQEAFDIFDPTLI